MSLGEDVMKKLFDARSKKRKAQQSGKAANVDTPKPDKDDGDDDEDDGHPEGEDDKTGSQGITINVNLATNSRNVPGRTETSLAERKLINRPRGLMHKSAKK